MLCARLKGVTHIDRHLSIGVTYSSIEKRTIARRASPTDALVDLLDLVLIRLSASSPSSTDVPSERRLPAYLSAHTVEYEKR